MMLYRIGAGWTASVAQMEEALHRVRFLECRPTQEKSVGWIEPRGEKHGALVESLGGQLILKFMFEAKLLPASVVRRAAVLKMEQIEASTGRKPGKKEAKDIRESLLQQMLPQAFTRQASVLVWIDPMERLLAIDTTALAKADEVVQSLVRAFGGFTVALVETQDSPHAAMSAWLTERAAPGHFDLDRECELKGTDDMQSAVRYSRHLLDIVEIRQHVEGGKLPTRLAMSWEGKVSFLLTDTLQIKKLRFLDGVFKEGRADDEDRFDADATIFTGEMKKLIPQLIKALGGEAKAA